jgi:hypothetical protein
MSLPSVEHLSQQADALAQRVISEMYRDPFWLERFGERGRQHALADARYHVSYLEQALTLGDPEIFLRYARWLQTVLVSRGMCSRHLEESFAKLQAAIQDDVPRAGDARDLLEQGRRALTYGAGGERELQECLPRLAEEVDRPEYGEQVPATHTAHPLYQLSYLADALHAARPEWFEAQVCWLKASLERQGKACTPLLEQLSHVARCLDDASWASPELARAAQPIVARALSSAR